MACRGRRAAGPPGPPLQRPDAPQTPPGARPPAHLPTLQAQSALQLAVAMGVMIGSVYAAKAAWSEDKQIYVSDLDLGEIVLCVEMCV